ncbi:protein SCO1/2 [Devosia lucknowensis]|uniref:Protein SCO1/2 n=1 Tax=Devosia lucknowensis TaxID=1096929 RepID=A0A1Y6F187_9HYPH|nr:SCO family protein [Devosia lucknowensis]SMQ68605.1 protein SCO1/2 [Devosia lucknowensis]
MAGNFSLRNLRIVLWVLVAVAAGGAAFLAYGPRVSTADAGEAIYAKPFTLVNQAGAQVTQTDFIGRPSAWFYGFTHCPDVCPTALSEMSAILDALGPDADKLQVVFVSVDPERDTPEIMRDYVDYFDPRIAGLTGDLDQVTIMARDRYIFFEKVPMEGGDYTMEHQASIQLVTADGRFFGTLAAEEGFDVRLAKIRRLIDEG